MLSAASAWACGWSYETFVAETGSLPCVEAVAVMRPPRHAPLLLQRQVDVAELALALIPGSLAAYDARTNAWLHLGKVDRALESAKARAALAPGDYGSRANLGTVLTFTGELDAALVEVKATLEKDPNAHFGRERFHAQLLEYLIALKADPSLATKRDFLGLSLTKDDALKGNPAKVPAGARDALVSMLGVYGAAENPHVLYALGNVLALEREPKLAFAAWFFALQKHHPAEQLVVPWMLDINTAAHEEWLKTSNRIHPNEIDIIVGGNTGPLDLSFWRFSDNWAGLAWSSLKRQELWEARQKLSWDHEQKQLALGTPVWTEAGLSVLVTYQRRLGLRCPSAPARMGATQGLFDAAAPAKASEAGRAWLSALESLVGDVQDARSCANLRPALLARWKKTPPPKTAVADRLTMVGDPATAERFFEVFDRLALVLAKCAPKSGNDDALTEWE